MSGSRRGGLSYAPADLSSATEPPVAAPVRVAVVLPPGEGFGPGAAGAVGLLVRRVNRAASGEWAPLVLGLPSAETPFDLPPFLPVRLPALWPWGRTRRYIAGLRRELRRLRPAVIEVHNRPVIARALAASFPEAKVSLFLHNDPRTMRGARSVAERRDLLRRLAAVVVVSELIGAHMAEGCAAGAARGPVTLPNCLDLAEIPPAVAVAAREKLVLFVGRIVPEKGVDRFIAAFAAAAPRLLGWRAAVLGASRLSEASEQPAFARAVRQAAGAAGVTIEGYRPHAAVLARMAGAAIVVVPSRWEEPFGLAALEAMACGAALVCSPRGNLRALTEGAAVLVDPDDPQAIAAAVVALAGDPARREALGAAGMARARQFGVEAAAARLGALRRSLVGAGVGG